MKARVLSTIIAGSLVAVPMVAAADPGQFFVTPFVGVQDFSHDRDAGKNGVFGIGGEYQFSEHFGTELDYTRSFKGMQSGSTDVDYDRLSLDGIYYIGNGVGFKSIYQPYLKLGVGHNRYDYDAGPNDQNTDIDAGLGVRIALVDRLALRAEAKAIHEVDDSQTHGLFTLGLSYAFGGTSKPVEAPAPAPAPVVAAPVDSDGDGVYDDKDKCPGTPRGREVDSDGCEFVLHKTEEIRLDINFAVDKAVITEAYVGEVEKTAKFLKHYGNVKAEIAGHTDSTGSDAYNQKLSQRRADAVRDMLINRYGIDASRLTAVGYGESKPIASNATADGRAQNRRVVAVMQAETTQPAMKK